MEDLKENIQKKNMGKLVLSAALGMFCYCSNNVTMGMDSHNEVVINSENNNIILKDRQQDQNYESKLEISIQLNGEEKKKSTKKNSTQNSTITEKINEECCPCCCCHNKEDEGDEGSPKTNENKIPEVEEKNEI